MRHRDGARDVFLVLLERLLERRIYAASREIGDASKRRDRDPTRAAACALIERSRVGRAAVANAGMVRVFDGPNRDAADRVVACRAPAVRALD